MIFKETEHIMPWQSHDYNDLLDFKFRSARVSVEDVRISPASRYSSNVHTIHQEFRQDGGSFLTVPMTGFTSVGATMTKLGGDCYVPGKNAQTTLEVSSSGIGMATWFDSSKKMWRITRDTPGHATNRSSFSIRPYALIVIGEPSTIRSVTPSTWVQNYRRRAFNDYEYESWDIDSGNIVLLKQLMYAANLYWSVLAVKSPVGYSDESVIGGEIEEMTMPGLKFSGNPSADTVFGYLELGCDITSWVFTYN